MLPAIVRYRFYTYTRSQNRKPLFQQCLCQLEPKDWVINESKLSQGIGLYYHHTSSLAEVVQPRTHLFAFSSSYKIVNRIALYFAHALIVPSTRCEVMQWLPFYCNLSIVFVLGRMGRMYLPCRLAFLIGKYGQHQRRICKQDFITL